MRMRSKQRKHDLGEVFTPMPLVSKMLRQLPSDTWTDPAKRVGDITGCGHGNFLVAVLKLKIAGGSTPEQALSTCYGIDIMHDNIDEARQRLVSIAVDAGLDEGRAREIVERNVVCGDALTYDWSMHH